MKQVITNLKEMASRCCYLLCMGPKDRIVVMLVLTLS